MYVNKKYQWLKCKIIDYDINNCRYQVGIVDIDYNDVLGYIKYVVRTSLRLKYEKIDEFNDRVNICYNLRDVIMKELKFKYYVE